jgi:hypothetical protein
MLRKLKIAPLRQWLATRLLHRRLVRQGRRLIYVTTADHAYTILSLLPDLRGHGVAAEIWSYERVFARRKLPRATYVLTDFDRLSVAELKAAGAIAAHLRAAGLTVLNDPATFLHRDRFLRRLKQEGINTFTCWRPSEGEEPDRFPVFLRGIYGHSGPLTDLLPDLATARAELARLVGKGHPVSDLLFIEFAAETLPGSDLYLKLASFRVGDMVIMGNAVGDRDWNNKYGILTPFDDEHYRQEREEFDRWQHEALARRVFDLSGITFGRIDFGMYRGRPEIFEVNSNPSIKFKYHHPSAHRIALMRRIQDCITAKLAELTPVQPDRPIVMKDVFRASEVLPKRPRR